eukprot:TRINITY_DN23066_c0_g1_i1.p1 TRINITY_DN23066_c0_g1~~TRINITY_DN23066_c0_g1_i1.p1  ORF type:complete len:789 (-),score=111.24 TRINITY_DN23066_c0_g1_i1:88-2454(-)
MSQRLVCRVVADFRGEKYGREYLTLEKGEHVISYPTVPQDGWGYAARLRGERERGWCPPSFLRPLEQHECRQCRATYDCSSYGSGYLDLACGEYVKLEPEMPSTGDWSFVKRLSRADEQGWCPNVFLDHISPWECQNCGQNQQGSASFVKLHCCSSILCTCCREQLVDCKFCKLQNPSHEMVPSKTGLSRSTSSDNKIVQCLDGVRLQQSRTPSQSKGQADGRQGKPKYGETKGGLEKIPRVYPLDFKLTSELPASILDGPMDCFSAGSGMQKGSGITYSRLAEDDIEYVHKELRKWLALGEDAASDFQAALSDDAARSSSAGGEDTKVQQHSQSPPQESMQQKWRQLCTEAMLEFRSTSEARTAATLVSNTQKGDEHHARQVVSNYQRAYRWLHSRETCCVDKSLLCELHKLIMEGLDARTTHIGTYRIGQASIGPVVLFPKPAEVNDLMEDFLLHFGHLSKRADVSFVAVAAYFLNEFLSIHPFYDGNGRVARLLCDFILCSHRMPFPVNLCMSEDQRRELTASIRSGQNTSSEIARQSKDVRLASSSSSARALPALVSESYCPKLRRLIWHQIHISFMEYRKILQKKEEKKTELERDQIIRQQRESLRLNETCVVCLEGGVNLNLLCCGSCYHFDCLLRWLGTQNGANQAAEASCATCRNTITKDIRTILREIRRAHETDSDGATGDSSTNSDDTDTTTTTEDSVTMTLGGMEDTTTTTTSDGSGEDNSSTEEINADTCRVCKENLKAWGCVLECCKPCCRLHLAQLNRDQPGLGQQWRCLRHEQ